MPTYEYRCQSCGATFEQVQHISEHATAQPSCPKCQSDDVQQLMSSFVAQTRKKS